MNTHGPTPTLRRTHVSLIVELIDHDTNAVLLHARHDAPRLPRRCCIASGPFGRPQKHNVAVADLVNCQRVCRAVAVTAAATRGRRRCFQMNPHATAQGTPGLGNRQPHQRAPAPDEFLDARRVPSLRRLLDLS